MRAAIILTAAVLVSACATVDKRLCPQERIYTRAEQQALLKGMKVSPEVIRQAMADYGRLRDLARACRGERVP
jgi:hypothetical protein